MEILGILSLLGSSSSWPLSSVGFAVVTFLWAHKPIMEWPDGMGIRYVEG